MCSNALEKRTQLLLRAAPFVEWAGKHLAMHFLKLKKRTGHARANV